MKVDSTLMIAGAGTGFEAHACPTQPGRQGAFEVRLGWTTGCQASLGIRTSLAVLPEPTDI